MNSEADVFFAADNSKMTVETKELGKFTLLEHMGTGGVASVYRAVDNETGNIVAIKLFETGEQRTRETAGKLRDREVRMLIRVEHPNVVRYYESGDADETTYYTMEFVENSLAKWMRKSDEYPLPDKIHILRQTANALQAIHRQGIVHRDIKPANVLLDQDPNGALHVKVTDFGIAKHVSEPDPERTGESSRKVPGTPKYLSPEQIQLKSVDGRADIFSLGVVAYEIVSGKAPFRVETSEEYVKANLNMEPEPLEYVNPEIPPFISRIVAKMLVKDREERYDSDTLARDLELTYQHLVSNAPLLEPSNPDSVFYVPPVPETPEPAQPRRMLATVSWVAAGVLIVAGGICSYAFWPTAPGQPSSQKVQNPRGTLKLSSQESLQEAARLLKGGQAWAALSVLGKADAQQLDEKEKQELDALRQDVQAAVAQPAYAAGTVMINEGRLAEAEIVLQMMQAFSPASGPTQALSASIQAKRQSAVGAQNWQESLELINALLARREYEEAVAQAEAAWRESAADSQKQAALQPLLIVGLNGWGNSLMQRNPVPAKLEAYLEAFSRYRGAGWAAGSLEDRSGELYLRLARYYEGVGAMERAAGYYEIVAKQYTGDISVKANTALAEIVRQRQSEPMDLEPLSKELEKNGLKSGIWRSQVPDDGSQTNAGGALLIVQKGGREERINFLETQRPIRNKQGFQVGVKFRRQSSGPGKGPRCDAGLEVQDIAGNTVAFSFDGAHYNLSRSYRRYGRILSGGASVAQAFGDEGSAWHEISFRYVYELGRLVAFVDGKQVEEYQSELGDCRVRVFVRITGEGDGSAEFKDILCRP